MMGLRLLAREKQPDDRRHSDADRRRNQWLNRPLDGTLRGRVFVVEIPLQGRIAASAAGAVSSVG